MAVQYGRPPSDRLPDKADDDPETAGASAGAGTAAGWERVAAAAGPDGSAGGSGRANVPVIRAAATSVTCRTAGADPDRSLSRRTSPITASSGWPAMNC